GRFVTALRQKPITATLSPFSSIEAVGRSWRQLEQRAACSFFQSWNWIGTWLSLLRQPAKLYLLEVVEGDKVIGLGLFGARRLARHGFVRSRALLLHETGSAE